MEKNFMTSDTLIEFEFITTKKVGIHYHENFELLYIINGTIKIMIDEDQFNLLSGDCIVINTNRNHSYQASEDILMVRFILSYMQVRKLIGQSTILFWCNSVNKNNKSYSELKGVMIEILKIVIKDEEEPIYLHSLYYKLVHFLISNFLLAPKDMRYENEKSKTDDRMQEIFTYIRANYRQAITLQDLSEKLFLSSNYLSKYIKKKCDINFIELLNTVRLSHAIEDLLHTDASIMKIAMNNGFASIASFNKTFKKVYDSTPSMFRKRKQLKLKSIDTEKQNKLKDVQDKIATYLEKIPVKEYQVVQNLSLSTKRMINSNEQWTNSYCSLINIGTVLDITKASIQKQIIEAKDSIQIEYVRFWDIYLPKLYANNDVSKDKRYFGHLDLAIDFLNENNLKPYIALGYKHNNMLNFSTKQEMALFYNNMIVHFIKRYGMDYVSSWYFEFMNDDLVEFQLFLEEFDIILQAFHKHLSSIKIGGGGFNLNKLGLHKFKQELELWSNYHEIPRFISLKCFLINNNSDKITDYDFVLQQINAAKAILKECNLELELHVSEYSLSLSNNNIVNDSIIKAAFLAQNAILCSDKVTMLGYCLFSDAHIDFYNTRPLLFGGNGLLSKHGIPKPSFYALKMLKNLYRQVVIRNAHCLVTKNAQDQYAIMCQNYKSINDNDRIDENKISVNDLPNMLKNKEFLRINIKIEHIKNGDYMMSRQDINQNSGSLQDEWRHLNFESDINIYWVNYLRRVSTPRIFVQNILVEENILELDITLKPNEIQLFNIMYKGD